jgi:hypothetical protein
MKSAKARVTAEAAMRGWTVRDDGGPGKVTDYLRPAKAPLRDEFIRVYYDRLGRIVSVRDEHGDRLVTGGDREGKVRVLLD